LKNSIKFKDFNWLIAFLVVLSTIITLTYANYRFSEDYPGGNDFLARWMGARMWLLEGISPYSPQVSLASQRMIYGRPADPTRGEDVAHFVYPLPSMVFFAPFGLLEYTTARAVWMTLLQLSAIMLTILSIRLARWRISLWMTLLMITFAFLWYPNVRTIVLGQFAGISVLLVVASLLAITRKQDDLAGALLVFSLFKPQVSFLLAPFVLLWALSVRRYHIIWGFMATSFTLLLVSIILIPDWPVQWLRQVFEYPSYTDRIGSGVSIIAGLMPGISGRISLLLYVVFIAYLLYEWFLAWRKEENWFLWVAMMTLVISTFVAPRSATTHYGMLLPAIFLLFRVWQERWGTSGNLAILLSILFLFVGQWLLFLVTVQGVDEQAIMYLLVPFYCLLGLWWVRWWSLRSVRFTT
jgi:hypothetical protein